MYQKLRFQKESRKLLQTKKNLNRDIKWWVESLLWKEEQEAGAVRTDSSTGMHISSKERRPGEDHKEGRFKLKELLTFCVYRMSSMYFKGAVALKYSFKAIKHERWSYMTLQFPKKVKNIIFAAQKRLEMLIFSQFYKSSCSVKTCRVTEKPLHKSGERTKRKRMAFSCETRIERRQKCGISDLSFPVQNTRSVNCKCCLSPWH